MSPRLRTFLVWLLLIALFVGIYALLRQGEGPHVSDATFYADLTEGRLRRVLVDDDDRIHAERVDGTTYATDVAYTESVDALIRTTPVTIDWWEGDEDVSPSTWIVLLFVVVFVLALVVAVVRRLRGGPMGNVLTLRRTTARLIAERPKVGWDDVGGADEAKQQLKDTVAFLREPAKWQTAGARPPRGILLEGPPGFGKTLLAKAVAGEAKLPFFEVSATEFVELFVGVGAARVRDLFDEAKKKAPCVIFIDEIDAVGRRRGGVSTSLTHQEREQALDQLLVSMDGFAPRDSVVVIAATNRADVLDPALLRPGRFDMVLRVGDFSEADRLAVLRVHARGKPVEADLAALAARTSGFSGAELEQILNAAAMAAARRQDAQPKITQADVDAAHQRRKSQGAGLDLFDLFLAESAAGLAKPVGPLELEATTRSGEVLRGRAAWADPQSIKLVTETGPVVLARGHVASLRPLGDVAAARPEQLARDEQPDAG